MGAGQQLCKAVTLCLRGRQAAEEDGCDTGNARQKGICKDEPELTRLP